jgi:hypothetical protein
MDPSWIVRNLGGLESGDLASRWQRLSMKGILPTRLHSRTHVLSESSTARTGCQIKQQVVLYQASLLHCLGTLVLLGGDVGASDAMSRKQIPRLAHVYLGPRYCAVAYAR